MRRRRDPDRKGDVHENVRKSTKGVESRGDKDEDRRAAAGLIGGGASGKGEMTDPRYIAPR